MHVVYDLTKEFDDQHLKNQSEQLLAILSLMEYFLFQMIAKYRGQAQLKSVRLLKKALNVYTVFAKNSPLKKLKLKRFSLFFLSSYKNAE